MSNNIHYFVNSYGCSVHDHGDGGTCSCSPYWHDMETISEKSYQDDHDAAMCAAQGGACEEKFGVDNYQSPREFRRYLIYKIINILKDSLCVDQVQYDNIMKCLEDKTGIVWRSGSKPTNVPFLKEYKSYCISYSDDGLVYNTEDIRDHAGSYSDLMEILNQL